MDLIKSDLTEFKWVIPNLITHVKEKIIDSLKLSSLHGETSTTYLSSNLYKPGAVNSDLPQSKCNPLTIITANSKESTYIQKQISTLFDSTSAQLVDPLNLRIEAATWISEFNNLCRKEQNYNCLTTFLEYAFMLDGVNFRGASHPHFLSSLFLHLNTEHTKLDFFVSIIHEAAHQELFLINLIDRLVNAKYDFNMIHAPYQNKVRPPIGRLHSLHALFRMIQFLKFFDDKNHKLEFFLNKFTSNLKSFEQGELTDFSVFLVEEIYASYSNTF